VREDGTMVGGEEWQEKVYDREEWKKLLRTARNRRILHMPMEQNSPVKKAKEVVLRVSGRVATEGKTPHCPYFEILPLGGNCACILLSDESPEKKYTCALFSRNCLHLSLGMWHIAPTPWGEVPQTTPF
jgi:hypothetical protein